MEQSDTNEQSLRNVGLELHEAETAISLGRQTIQMLRQAEPVDEQALIAERMRVEEARLRRNTLRRDLYVAKTTLSPIGRIEWIR